MKVCYLFTIPFAILFLLDSRRIHPGYRLNWWKKIAFGVRLVRNKHSIPTAVSFKTALAMSLKLFELSPNIPGDVIECGTRKSGTAASLSLACRIVGRKLIVCDSFEGLPPRSPMDRETAEYKPADCARLP